ncbi:MAG: thioredoxin family protein [Elusimicrobia bacterium]|nr:thioredoxin family protein [Elusimicrobiota bacterium]
MKIALAALMLIASAAHAAPELGKPAPDFTLADQNGKPVKLSGARGKLVVLEWFNKGCPFVRKHYGSQNMQGLQKKYAKKGVVWYSIISSKEGKEGYMTPAQAKEEIKEAGMGAKAILSDASGDVGRLYNAKTTPHMFIVDKKGNLIYMGGIDDTASADPADIKTSKNYVAAALDEALAGQPVSTPSSRPYGCSVKY